MSNNRATGSKKGAGSGLNASLLAPITQDGLFGNTHMVH
tara:strand:+ start:90 stop:206 length:117 start_codon:yes stop_codon:yes gene_type:complete